MIPAKFRSRKFIMSLAAAIVGLIVVFVPEHADTVESLVMQVAGLVVMAGSIVGWVVTEGSVDKERERSRQRQQEVESNERMQNASREQDRNGGYGHAGTLGMIALVAICTLGAAGLWTTAGCVSANGRVVSIEEMSPERAYMTQLRIFNEATMTAIRAKQAGLVSQQTYDDVIYPLIREADLHLERAREARDAGETTSFRDASRSLQAVLDRLLLKIRPLEEQVDELGRLENSLEHTIHLRDRLVGAQHVGLACVSPR